jgi:hypothetical protein
VFTISVSSYNEVWVTLTIVYSLRTDVPVQTRGKERSEVRIFLYLSNIYNIYNNYYVFTSSHITCSSKIFFDRGLLLKERELPNHLFT